MLLEFLNSYDSFIPMILALNFCLHIIKTKLSTLIKLQLPKDTNIKQILEINYNSEP